MRTALRYVASYLFVSLCYAIAGGTGLLAYHFGGWVGIVLWLIVAFLLARKFAPNGWDDVNL